MMKAGLWLSQGQLVDTVALADFGGYRAPARSPGPALLG
jgi:hypothetical protein